MIRCLGVFSICLGLVIGLSSLPTEAAVTAAGGETKLKLTIVQSSLPDTKGEDSIGEAPIYKNPGNQGSVNSNGKRLPVTGETYSQFLSRLGYLAVGVTVLLFIIGKERKGRTYEATE